MEALDVLQWPAMLITIGASWLVGSEAATRRKLGFWAYLASNVLWIAWGLHAGAQALVVLQLALAAMNVRGERKNERVEAREQGGGEGG
jgi:hypothetical protein